MTFIKAEEPPSTNPPTFFLSFDVSIAPPTTVHCQVGGTLLDVIELNRVVLESTYLPPPTNVVTNVTLRSRMAGEYQCNVSVFRASGSALEVASTPPLTIMGECAFLSVIVNVRRELAYAHSSSILMFNMPALLLKGYQLRFWHLV